MGRWAILNVFLGLVVVLLGVEIARTWARALPVVEVPERPPPAGGERREKGKRGGERGAAARNQQAAPAAMVAAINDKDLFDPSRRAPSEEMKAAEVPRETGPPPGLTVVGVRIFGKDREAFVTDASQANAQRRLRVGDQILGYTLKAIEPAGLTLSSPSGDPVKMPLEVDKGRAAVPPQPGRPGGPARPGQPPVPGTSPAAGVRGVVPPSAGVRPPPPPPMPPGGVPPAPVAVPGRPPTAMPPGVVPAPVPQAQQQLQQLQQHQKGRRK